MAVSGVRADIYPSPIGRGAPHIDDTPKIERHVYEGAGYAWDCFPYFPKFLVAKDPEKFGRLLKKLKGACANKFDGPNKAVTEDAFKRTLAFFKKHVK